MKCLRCIEERRQQVKITDMTIEEMCTTTEKQLFDRKSAKIDATAIATPMIAFANADGGLLAVGIEDNGEITGIDDYTIIVNMNSRKNINEVSKVDIDYNIDYNDYNLIKGVFYVYLQSRESIH